MLLVLGSTAAAAVAAPGPANLGGSSCPSSTRRCACKPPPASPTHPPVLVPQQARCLLHELLGQGRPGGARAGRHRGGLLDGCSRVGSSGWHR